MSEGILDTTFFIDWLRGDAGAGRLWGQILNGDISGYYTALSMTELWASPHFNPAEAAVFTAMRRDLTELPLTIRAAELAGMFLRDLPSNQRPHLAFDALIGSVALDTGIPLYTRNVKHLDRFTFAIRSYSGGSNRRLNVNAPGPGPFAFSSASLPSASSTVGS